MTRNTKTVYFKMNSAKLSDEAQKDLDDLFKSRRNSRAT